MDDDIICLNLIYRPSFMNRLNLIKILPIVITEVYLGCAATA
jgi:hypothetical protein